MMYLGRSTCASMLAVSLLWLPTGANAETQTGSVRTNFTFERVSHTGNSSARRGERGYFSFFGWGRRSRFNDQPAITKRKIKPEPLLSRANLYGPVVQLKVTGDDEIQPEGVYAKALHARLKGQASDVLKVRADRVAPIIEFYKSRKFEPLWVGDDGLNTRARRLLKQLATARLDGLRREEYQPRSLDEFNADSIGSDATADDLAAIELELTRAALRYARDISSGQVTPSKISRAIDVRPVIIETGVILSAMATTVRPDSYLQQLAPQTNSYRRLKQELAGYRELERSGGWTQVSKIGKLKPGRKHRAVVQLRQRLTEEGFLEMPAPVEVAPVDHDAQNTENYPVEMEQRVSESLVYDAALVDAVKKFQSQRGLKVDGVVGGRTVATLNISVSHRVNQLIANLERRRWLPLALDKTHVQVNQAAFQLRFFEGGDVIFKTRVIVGKRAYQTPEFSNRIKLVVFNPYWNVPRSIALEEMLPKLLMNPGALSGSFEVFGRSGGARDSYDVDWDEAVDNGFPYTIRQKPGPGNALGNVKFLFPNKHNIYLHDTPSRGLFSRIVRTFSHGCVRVQRSRDFAKVIMGREGWSGAKVGSTMDARKNRRVDLNREIPVHLTYRTAWIDESGGLHFLDDFYGRDRRLQIALGQMQMAMK